MGTVIFESRSPDGVRREQTVDFCEPNLNLLAHAQAIELDVGSRCGGHGKCGGDRLRVLGESARFLSPITEDERRWLSVEELARGFRLGCQCFPENADADIRVEFRV
jgi:ferredoxin